MLIPILKGLITYVPGINIHHLKKLSATPAEYYYSVWMRHMVLAHQNGLDTNPHTLAEFGPGGAIGVGLMALLCGTTKYFAFDVVPHTNLDTNLHILEELIILLKKQTSIPHTGTCRTIKPELSGYAFPTHIFTKDRLEASLHPKRVQAIRENLISGSVAQGIEIKYYSPWYEKHSLPNHCVDIIISQAVLEHVDALDSAYRKMALWLKPLGFMSHQIDFKSHGTAATWDGHWTYSDWVWRLIRGNRSYLLNRQPYSYHLKLLYRNGFDLHYAQKVEKPSGLDRNSLALKFKGLSDEDMETSGVFIQALKNS